MLYSSAASNRVLELRDPRRQQRVRENIERLIEVGAGVVRRDAGAETDFVLWNGRVIDGRHPQSTPAQFMPEVIETLAVPDDDRHDVGGRVPGVDPERIELAVKIFGVLPETLTQFWPGRSELERFRIGCDHHRRESAGINVGMRIEPQIIDHVLGPGDKSTHGPECYRERAVKHAHPLLDL